MSPMAVEKTLLKIVGLVNMVNTGYRLNIVLPLKQHKNSLNEGYKGRQN
jgi:hypothetical protein